VQQPDGGGGVSPAVSEAGTPDSAAGVRIPLQRQENSKDALAPGVVADLLDLSQPVILAAGSRMAWPPDHDTLRLFDPIPVQQLV
ncbi:MAG: hypothetical protein ACKPKO_39115, partial [Candidatus Fonsibacter sp.]